jgi:tRNA-specific 2-thiouridylase
MLTDALASHLLTPLARGHTPDAAHTGAAGGAACGDLVRISLALDSASPVGLITDAGFDASGCGSAIAAGSAAVALIRGQPLLRAARVGAREIEKELGGLSPAKRHAAELAADALHRALGSAARAQAQLAPDPARTLVAMSGGVDSAVAALLVGADGGETVAVTLELWSDPDNDGERSCCSAEAVRGARELAHGLGMPHFSVDLRAEFRAGVVDPWIADHAAGLTPNPCVRCNGNVRLDAMLDFADRLGAPTLATGHYARLAADRQIPGGERDPGSEDRALLRIAADAAKDQSYMLARLEPASLARMRFPLGALHKAQVREHALAAGLSVARKPDSQDLCFLAGTSPRAFLARHGGISDEPGPIVDRAGAVLGAHSGHQVFTVGQRRGLGVGGSTEPLYVLSTDGAANSVTLGPRAALAVDTVTLRDVTLRREAASVDRVRVRYRSRALACSVQPDLAAGHHEHAVVALHETTSRPAPGQQACLMAGELVVGHATIASS